MPRVDPRLEHFLFENALLTRKRQPPQCGVHSGENRVFRLNATFDFHKKSKVICSRTDRQHARPGQAGQQPRGCLRSPRRQKPGFCPASFSGSGPARKKIRQGRLTSTGR
ncbi:hypothetical protein [Desulfovibrio sp. ZJ200]|uniref:hypothetical protein n=1 Tax=Desulfovibrio sp. ZJ200 TaxID=2709792 RepID=UPI0013EB4C62|nr:hypothetical protein [Desulfovibrio sp. ZJ200]